MSRVRFKKNKTISHVIVARNKALSPVSYQNLPCHVSLTILGLMSTVKFKTMLFVPRIPMSPVNLKNAPCHPVTFKKWPCCPVHFTGYPQHRENRENGEKNPF